MRLALIALAIAIAATAPQKPAKPPPTRVVQPGQAAICEGTFVASSDGKVALCVAAPLVEAMQAKVAELTAPADAGAKPPAVDAGSKPTKK